MLNDSVYEVITDTVTILYSWCHIICDVLTETEKQCIVFNHWVAQDDADHVETWKNKHFVLGHSLLGRSPHRIIPGFLQLLKIPNYYPFSKHRNHREQGQCMYTTANVCLCVWPDNSVRFNIQQSFAMINKALTHTHKASGVIDWRSGVRTNKNISGNTETGTWALDRSGTFYTLISLNRHQFSVMHQT